MRNRHLILLLSILLATFLVAGCGSTRQMTQGETDQFKAISTKIDMAENMTPRSARECVPKELAYAKAELDSARHETGESWENASADIAKAGKAADDVLGKTIACQLPAVNFSANPDTISPGQCSTLKWTMEYAKKGLWGPGKKPAEVPTTGSKEVCPKETTDYQIGASGSGGTTYAVATVTVKQPVAVAPPPPPPPPAAAPVVAPVVIPKEKPVMSFQVNFDTDKYTIRPADLAELQKGVEFVKQHPDLKIHLVGYTDSRGSAKYNQKLSEKRAEAVKKYIEGEVTIAPENISSDGKGEANPVGDNKTKEGQFLNRRVELMIK
ncbi:MAG: OmpA family protein [Deltaproteobacteria bacterium]|nr:MAG: OmpA family protein [Deltaproteobacteria bacterium]